MSLSYASRLTQNVDYGECGLVEHEDTGRVRAREMEKLAKLIGNARYLVIHTGAGVSTSCGIRDFRGPNGIWTREKLGLGLNLLPGDVPFDEASPSLTHQAIKVLVDTNRCRYVVSQNVDGLHLRGHLDTSKLSELHGNIFQEGCRECGRVYFRNFDVGGCGFAETPRQCIDCGHGLFDMVLDWEDALPETDYRLARQHSLLADVALALGTSMKVHPAATIPLITVDKSQRKHSALSGVDEEEIFDEDFAEIPEAGTAQGRRMRHTNGSLAIINLQATPHDQDSKVRLHGRCDDVMHDLMKRLKLVIPDFVRHETYSVLQDETGLITFVTDLFVGNCLFVSSISVSFADESISIDAAPWKTRLNLKEKTMLTIEFNLNENATERKLLMEHLFVPETHTETHEPFLVVRKAYGDQQEQQQQPPVQASNDNGIPNNVDQSSGEQESESKRTKIANK